MKNIKGISLIVLMITIVVMIILASVVIVSSIDSIDNARLTGFAYDIGELEDAVESYYINHNEIPFPNESVAPITRDNIKEVSESENAEALEEEFTLNQESDTTEFFYLDLAKLNVKRISNGLKKSGENDVYVMAYPSMNVYYLKGVVVDGVKYFSISSKIANIERILGEKEGDDDSSTDVETHGGIELTKSNSWTCTMPLTVKTTMEAGQGLYISLSGVEKKLVTNLGSYSKSFNISDLFEANDILEIDSLFNTDEISTFNSLQQTEKYVEIIKKDENSEGKVIGRNKVELPNFEMELPQIAELANNSYVNMNITSFKAIDNISKIKEVKYDYLTQISEDGVEKNYYEGISEFNISYLRQNGKTAQIGQNGEVNIQLNKNIKKLVVGLIDNAGNWIIETINVDSSFYIGTVVDTSTPQTLKLTANVYSSYGLSMLKFSISTDAQNYTGEQIFTYNSTDLITSQQVQYTGIGNNSVYVKIEATDNNPDLQNKKIVTRVITVDSSGNPSSPGDSGELKEPEIIISPTTITNEVTVIVDYFSASTKEYAITSSQVEQPTVWQTYTGMFTIHTNGCIWAKGKNTAGNEKVSTLEVSNIDSIPPLVSLSDNGSTSSSISVKAAATDSGGSGLNESSYQYSKDNGTTWTATNSSDTYTFNNLPTGTYQCRVKVRDKAGNESISNTLTISTTGISTITMGANPTGWTNGNVTVAINYPAEVVTREYRIGSGGTWTTYAGPITISANDTIYARGYDVAGNQAAQSTITITNIDKTVPSNATISVAASGSNVTGNLTLADTGGSGINVTNSKYVIATTGTAYAVDNSIWTTTNAKSITTNPRSISEAKADANYYVQVLSVDNAGNKRVNVSAVVAIKTKIGNTPALVSGMTPIKWDASNNIVATTTSDPDWYDYAAKKWANARTADGSMWVWIPRYEYMITTPHSSTAQVIAVNFLSSTSTTATSGYIVHPAFTFGSVQLTGIWVAKFEASGSTTAVNVKQGVASLRSVTLDSAFIACRNMESNSRYGWGTSGTGFDTHLMKNIEWGVAAYLSDSRYGKNGSEVAQNTSSSYYTGGGTETAYITNVAQSTTGNVYGIYDMSGGAFEFVAAYSHDSGSSTLNNADAKYKDVYTGIASTTPTSTYSSASGKKGDAVYETSSATYDSYSDYTGNHTSWFSNASYMPGYTTCRNTTESTNSSINLNVFIRGGNFSADGEDYVVSSKRYFYNYAGIFAFNRWNATATTSMSFRPTIAVASGL